MKKQYIVSKYVMADSVAEALKKSKRQPVDEVYVHNAWLEKNVDHNMFDVKNTNIGFNEKK